MIKREQYLAGEVTHAEYYSQFVNDWQCDAVVRVIGLKKLVRNADDLSKIPISDWDRVPLGAFAANGLAKATDGNSIAGACCINKQAAQEVLNNLLKRANS